MDKKTMNFYGAPGVTVDKSGLYQAGGYPGANYQQTQTGMVQGLPQAQSAAAAAAAAAAHRFPTAVSQSYAVPPMAGNPSVAGYSTLSGYPTANGYPTASAYTTATPGTTGAFHAHAHAPSHAHAMQYAALQSIPSSTPAYQASQYPTGAPTYIGGSQLGATYAGNPVGIAVTNALHHPGSGYSGAPIASVPRGYATAAAGMSPMGYPNTIPGSNQTYPATSPYGGAQYPRF